MRKKTKREKKTTRNARRKKIRQDGLAPQTGKETTKRERMKTNLTAVSLRKS